MTRRVVHYQVETFYDCGYAPACENATGNYTDREVEMSDDEREVSCRKCLTALGYEAAPVEQLTVCEPDPVRRAA